MLNKILNSKVTSAASSQFVVFGLKMIDAHALTLRFLGIVVCAASLAFLFYGWHRTAATEASATALVPAVSAKSARKPSRSRASR